MMAGLELGTEQNLAWPWEKKCFSFYSDSSYCTLLFSAQSHKDWQPLSDSKAFLLTPYPSAHAIWSPILTPQNNNQVWRQMTSPLVLKFPDTCYSCFGDTPPRSKQGKVLSPCQLRNTRLPLLVPFCCLCWLKKKMCMCVHVRVHTHTC